MTRPLLGPRTSRTLSLALVGGAVLAVAGTVHLVGQTVATGSVTASAALSDRVRLQLDESLALPDGLGLAGYRIPVSVNTDDLPLGVRLLVVLGTVLPWVCAALAALALARVSWSLGSADPFRPGNARALASVAALWVVGSYLAPWVVHLASVRVLAAAGAPAGLDPADSTASLVVTWFGLLLVLAVAEVFRRGARQAHDVAGLV
ncbi:DUF2975 domain-containing protein [Klenkia brasiliensis]|uniref:DUF2975 domain-containing protein n=1 Tax=Klenkia brasiliensis TaxID=333142 RepID=A0A1G7ZTA9_9ACTN|nr:DUF2975 domain-containing protein [Klenkia brasiliensis]SDH11903.1 Protein of unknown function [Klenkia brasiliensis]